MSSVAHFEKLLDDAIKMGVYRHIAYTAESLSSGDRTVDEANFDAARERVVAYVRELWAAYEDARPLPHKSQQAASGAPTPHDVSNAMKLVWRKSWNFVADEGALARYCAEVCEELAKPFAPASRSEE